MDKEIVLVEWLDAYTAIQTLSIESIEKEGLIPAFTLGWLIHENKDRIAVCGFYFDFGDNQPGFRDVHFIPKSWIKKIHKLKI